MCWMQILFFFESSTKVQDIWFRHISPNSARNAMSKSRRSHEGNDEQEASGDVRRFWYSTRRTVIKSFYLPTVCCTASWKLKGCPRSVAKGFSKVRGVGQSGQTRNKHTSANKATMKQTPCKLNVAGRSAQTTGTMSANCSLPEGWLYWPFPQRMTRQMDGVTFRLNWVWGP